MPDIDLVLVFGIVLVVLGLAVLVMVGLCRASGRPAAAPPPEAAPPPLPAPAKVLPMPYGRWVWVASPGRSVLAHHPQHTGYTACGWRIDGYGHVVLSGAAVEDYQVSPCMRCFPGVPVMPGRLP